jgi:hypothetical protein
MFPALTACDNRAKKKRLEKSENLSTTATSKTHDTLLLFVRLPVHVLQPRLADKKIQLAAL